MDPDDHSNTDPRRLPTGRRRKIGKAIAAVGIIYAVVALSYGGWLLLAFVTSERPWNLAFGVALLAVAGILGWESFIRLRADPADPASYAASITRAAKAEIALSIVIALMGTINLGFFVAGAGLWSLAIGVAVLAVSALLGAAAGRQLRERARRAASNP